MPLENELREATRRWLDEDVDEDGRAELRELLTSAEGGDEGAVAELRQRVAQPLGFGTAGMRGPVRAGPNGMNRAVVVRTTAGLARWLHGREGVGTVVVGHDARHGSRRFAEDTAGVLHAAGFRVYVLPEALPTPLLVYATRSLGAVAGVQITASHNPPADNGYKVYLSGGTPLVAPFDEEIEHEIARVGPAREVERAEQGWEHYERVLDDYLARVETLPRGRTRDLRVAATALHGVGARPLRYALHLAGFTDVYLVADQEEPDPDFPTVEFPNPEEPGATDAVLELAGEVGAELAIALDPDADRCAVGVPAREGGWRMLRGDETGVLLGDHVLGTADRSGRDPLVATTIVSSAMLRSIAADHGVRYDETLTGFKWLMRAGDGTATGLVYAYEEALGHCVDPEYVRDKDGLSTAVVACDLAATLKARSGSLLDRLDELEARHGVHETGQLSVRVRDLSTIDETMRRLREHPPGELAGLSVSTKDLLPDADVLVLRGGTGSEGSEGPGGLRVVIRPSGTEPKLKCYLQAVEPVRDPASSPELTAARGRAREMMSALTSEVRALVES
ncbi:phosphomannomutase [Actinopolyspora biskrensis]|uniref:Phosphomannomutase n=1 Tax=Actinopolyspora biskrensis TaxID=1470178 RepID=A0A852YYR7_9ACTN|nr:phospho-sugar mutase [Actinopolyspora biskrensis]NYH79318.1 phosphomannomutase [Actinopolyspora biskrensis]